MLTATEAECYFVDPDYGNQAMQEDLKKLSTSSFTATPAQLQDRRTYRLGAIDGVGTGLVHEGYCATSVRLSIQGGPLRFGLADTGASLSLIDTKIASKLGVPIQHRELGPVNGLSSVSKLKGYVVIDITLPAQDRQGQCSVVIKHEFFLIDDLKPGILLGAELLDGHDAIVQLRRNRILFGEKGPWVQAYKLHSTRVSDNEAHILCAESDVVIEPGQSAWVKFRKTPQLLAKPDLLIERALWGDEAKESWFITQRCAISSRLGAALVTNVGSNTAIVAANMPFARARTFNDAGTVNVGMFALATPGPLSAEKTEELLATAEAACATTSEPPPSDPRKEAPPTAAPDKTAKVDDAFNVGIDPTTGAPWQRVAELLRKYKAAFSLDGKPGHVRYPGMKIPVERPELLTSQPPRRVPPAKREAIDDIVDELMALGIIETSDSPTSYPLLLIPKPTGWRMCVDYRKLNEVSTSDRYPLARADDIFDTLKGSKIFSALDAVKGYHQLDVAKEDQWKTAFVCHRGLFQYKRVPFGLKGAPAHFQRFMDGLLGELRWQSAMVYLDDVVIYSRNLDDHLTSLATLLGSAIDVGLKFDPKKSFFALSSLKLLGRLISADGISVLPDRARTVEAIRPPTTYGELTATLGFFNYYRQFIPRFAEKAAPLQRLLKGARYGNGQPGQKPLILPDGTTGPAHSLPLRWTDELDLSLETLKRDLVTAVTLPFADYDKPFQLYIDASQRAMAAALHQQFLIPLEGSAFPVSTTILDEAEWRDKIAKEQSEDPLWSHLISALKRGEPRVGYALQDGVLVTTGEDKVCLPKGLVREVLADAHRGHFGQTITLMAVKTSWTHPRLAELTHSYVKHCPNCIRNKTTPRTGEMVLQDDVPKPFRTLSLDVMHLPESDGLDACLIIVCTMSKATLFYPCKRNIGAVEIARALEDLVVRRGFQPRRIISDFDHRIIGQVGRALAHKLGATLTPSAPYHHQANPVERFVQTAKMALRKICDEYETSAWTKLIAPLELAINTSPSTTTGYAPFDLILIDRPQVLEELGEHYGTRRLEERLTFGKERVAQAISALRQARAKQKERYDKTRRPLPVLKSGDQVMLRVKDHPLPGQRQQTTLETRLAGPFTVGEVISPHRVRLNLPEGVDFEPLVDISQLQQVPEDDEYGRPGFAPDDGSQQYFEPLRIVDERVFYGHQQYRVKWRGSTRLTWEFEDDLLEDGCQALIQEWNDSFEFNTPPPPAAANEVNVAEQGTDTTIDDDVDSYDASAERASAPLYDRAADAMDKPLTRSRIVSINGRLYKLIERPIAFSSKMTSTSESKMLGSELELSGLAWAFDKFRHFLEGAQCTVITDHAPLPGILRAADYKITSPTLAMVRAKLMPYLHNFRFVYKPGKTHTNVDGLSRLRLSDESFKRDDG